MNAKMTKTASMTNNAPRNPPPDQGEHLPADAREQPLPTYVPSIAPPSATSEAVEQAYAVRDAVERVDKLRDDYDRAKRRGDSGPHMGELSKDIADQTLALYALARRLPKRPESRNAV